MNFSQIKLQKGYIWEITHHFMKVQFLLIVPVMLLFFTGCKKEEGFGGLASVHGKVYAYDYNNSGILVAEGYAGDIEVYIGAEGKSEVLDRIRTSHNGSFEITQLRKGNYEVWVYSDCGTCPNGIEPVIRKVSLTEKKSKVELEVFEINI